MSNSSCTPVPSAVMIACTSLFLRILSIRAFSTLRILPRIGRIAWKCGLRPPFAEPPAESPSTMYSSDLAGSVDWQSDSLPGSDVDSSRLLRRVRSRACRAATRARAACDALLMISLASPGFSSNQSRR